jgi:hypothetical protein
VKSTQRGVAPIVRPEFQEVQPEVTIAADITVVEEPEEAGATRPSFARARKKPAAKGKTE